MKFKRRIRTQTIVLGVIISVIIFCFIYVSFKNKDKTLEMPIEETDSTTEEGLSIEDVVEIKRIVESPEFQEKMFEEAQKIYWEEQKRESDEKLLELQDAGFTGEKVSMLKTFFQKHNSDLAYYASDIVKLPRWVEVVGIIGTETTFCKHGVGQSRNNCGAIKDSRTGDFKVYSSKLDAVKDVSNLLQNDLYKDKTIDEMNGIYCSDLSRTNSKCEGWEEQIKQFISDISTV